MKNQLPIVILALAAALASSSCSRTDEAAAPSKPAETASAAATNPYETLAAQGKGFTVGAMMSANAVYVMFDPQCPHCGHLWQASVPLQKKVKFVWMPVSFINAKSSPQGAALLSAANPAEAMSAHEASILAGTGGTAASSDIAPDLEAAIKNNTKLFNSMGVDSVPYVVGKNARTGALIAHTGAMDTAALAELLGVDVP